MVIMFIKCVLGVVVGISCWILKVFCVIFLWYIYNKYFKGFLGLNLVNIKVYRKVFNIKY